MPTAVGRRAGGHAPWVPAFGLGVVGLALAADQGGYAPSRWVPVALLAVGLTLGALVGGRPSASRRPPPVRAAIWGLALFAGWSLLSVAWAADRSTALAGGTRVAFYAVALGLFLVAWPRGAVRAILGLVVAGAGLIAVVTLARAAGPHGPSLFVGGRLSTPLGYANATADFWLIAVYPALGLVADAGLPAAVRSVALGIAGLLVETSLLSQSRGGILAVGVAALALVALHPRRGPALAALAALAAAAAAGSGTLLGVRHAHTIGELGRTGAHAAAVIAASGVLLTAVCAAWLWTIRRLPERIRATLTGPTFGNRLAAGLLAAGLLGWLALAGNPVTWTKDRWHDFKTAGYTTVESGVTRFNGSLGSNRFDFYRVALDEFLKHPVAGIGADNFQIPYLQHRRSPEAPAYPHSLELGVLAQTGIVGSAAFLLFLGGLLVAVRRSLRSLGAARGPAVAALCGGLAWLIHSSVDWLWAFPGLALPALLLLAVAARAEPGSAAEAAERVGPVAPVELDVWGRPRLRTPEAAAAPTQPGARVAAPTTVRQRAPRSLVGVAVVLAVVLGGLFVAVGLASHYERAADAEAAGNPTQARADFARAAEFDPFAATPLVSEAILARRAGLAVEASQSLQRALTRVGQSWFAHFEAGLLDAGAGAATRARDEFVTARMLDPAERVIGEAQAGLAAGRVLDPDALEAELVNEQTARLQPTQ